jgi:hypothetical protein
MPVGEDMMTFAARRWWMRALVIAGASAALVPSSRAATLHPGDVIVAEYVYASPPSRIVQLDPVTLAPTTISQGPLVTLPQGVAIDRAGRILVADYFEGVVRVDAATGAQSVLVAPDRLGGSAAGICLAPNGALFVTLRGSAPGVVRVTPDGATVTPVTSGNRITYPGNLTLGPDGALYVTEIDVPADNGGQASMFVNGRGSIVRVDPGSGAQSLIAADSLFMSPFDIAFVGPDEIWTAQAGYVSGRRGCFVRTRLSDGGSSLAVEPIDCRSRGLAVAPNGTVYIGDCHPIHIDCATLFVRRLPAGPDYTGASGPMAVVPQDVTPTPRRSWGSLKTIYR